MCNFLSGIVFENGDVITDNFTNSHDQLLKIGKARTDLKYKYCRVEFLPIYRNGKTDITDIANYELRVDHYIEPDWFADVASIVKEKMKARVKQRLIKADTVDFVHDTHKIAYGCTNIRHAQYSKITLLDQSRVNAYSRSLVELFDNSTANIYNTCTAHAFNKSKCKCYDDSHILLSDESECMLCEHASCICYGNNTVVLNDSSIAFVNKYLTLNSNPIFYINHLGTLYIYSYCMRQHNKQMLIDGFNVQIQPSRSNIHRISVHGNGTIQLNDFMEQIHANLLN